MGNYKFAEVRKTVVSVLSFLATALSLALAQGDLLPEGSVKYIIFFIALTNIPATYYVRNRDKPAGQGL